MAFVYYFRTENHRNTGAADLYFDKLQIAAFCVEDIRLI